MSLITDTHFRILTKEFIFLIVELDLVSWESSCFFIKSEISAGKDGMNRSIYCISIKFIFIIFFDVYLHFYCKNRNKKRRDIDYNDIYFIIIIFFEK